MPTVRTRSFGRVAQGICLWICALAGMLAAFMRIRRPFPGGSCWQEARIRVSVGRGLRGFGEYLAKHAAFDDYCRTRRSGGT